MKRSYENFTAMTQLLTFFIVYQADHKLSFIKKPCCSACRNEQVQLFNGSL